MRIRLFVPIIILLMICMNIPAQDKLIDYVDPFIGTDAHGHTYPGATLPFGMVQLSPDTDTEGWDWVSGYHYSDNSVMGFSHTHLSGTGIGDYGDILFIPQTGSLRTEPGSKDNPDNGYRSRFSRERENAHPGYYSVYLDDYSINVELTVTKRAGFHRYTFDRTETSGHILIDLIHGIQNQTTDTEVEIVDEKTIRGYRCATGWAKERCIYFFAEFSRPFKSYGIVEGKHIRSGALSAKGRDVKAFVDYDVTAGDEILVKVGISHTSIEGAEKNVRSEITHWEFDTIKKQAETVWEKELGAIKIETDVEKYKTIFYTALYHTLLAPNILSDVDGTYIGMDRQIHSTSGNKMYTVFSLWDTFRALHPLFTIIQPERNSELINALITKYREGGLLPVWELASNETETMIGYHSIPVIAEAFFKGAGDFDAEEAFEAMKHSAMQDHHGLKYYRKMGFIPSDLEHESVSKTLEYAYDDWCIAQMAKALGKEDDYHYFMERSKFWMNVFDPSTQLMRPKKNGRWVEPFDPYAVSGHYTEANSWQYSFFVPHDVYGLIKAMGGEEPFIDKLDKLFTADTTLTGMFQPDITGLIGQYAQGNEPSHHIAYLYNFAKAPWKTQEIVHEIMTTLYTENPDGLPGNEDCGQMSAWYIFSSLGFYPVTPGSPDYIIGTPLFKEAAIDVGEGKTFRVIARNVSDKNIYIQSAKLNGNDYPYSFIKHSDIMSGSELVFEMGPVPGEWGKLPGYIPVSSVDIEFVPVPYLISGERVFKDSVVVTLAPIDVTSTVYFTLDGSNPAENGNIFTESVVLHNTTTLKAVSEENGIYSKIVIVQFNKIPEGRSVVLDSEYSEKYTGGGKYGLIDGIRGTMNFRTDAWQGYEGVDLEAVVDLGALQEITRISASFLQETRSWIFYPKKVEYYISQDGVEFTKIYEAHKEPDEKMVAPGIKEFTKELDGENARYIRVIARNVGECPDWHSAAGGKAWLFIDQIEIQ
jgi:predicted alpha-1,2-mannosidase